MNISKGDIVVCIDNHSRENLLTLGKKYKVIDVYSYVGIIDDYGELYHYRMDRFKLDISYVRRCKLDKLKTICDGV